MIARILASTCVAALAAAAPARAADTTIAGVVFQQNMFMRSVQRGMQDASKAAGVTLLEGNSDNKAEKEASLVDTYVSRGAKAIMIAPISDKASSRR